MKYFGFFALGAVMAISMMYDYFSIFCMTVFISIILTLSVCKPIWNKPDNKKSASARQH